MQFIYDGIRQAFQLLLGGDPEVWEVALLSLQVSSLATLISLFVGLPLGTLLALWRFRGRGFTLSLINTGMALPPVVVGLVVSIFLWRSGPLGDLHIIYTPAAIVIAQTIIAAPAAEPEPAPAAAGAGGFSLADGPGFMAGSPPAVAGSFDGWLRRGHLRSRGFDDGGRKHPPPDARADHRHRAADQ
jgi:ABC-type phosphate/phosphonate transport system permease subunit